MMQKTINQDDTTTKPNGNIQMFYEDQLPMRLIITDLIWLMLLMMMVVVVVMVTLITNVDTM